MSIFKQKTKNIKQKNFKLFPKTETKKILLLILKNLIINYHFNQSQSF